MKATKRIEDYLKLHEGDVRDAVFSGTLKETINFGIAGQLGSSLLPEEVVFMGQYIQQVGGWILKTMKDLQVRTGVIVLKAGLYQGQEGVIVEIIGPPNSQDKRVIKYRVEINSQGQPGSKVTVDYTALEIERKQMSKGILST
jgi:hypothetical protein